FLREGCMQKHSKKGGQQRMFFLFSDKLVYASRLAAPLQFRVHGQMSLNGMMVMASIPHSFVIYTQDNKCIVVSTANDVEKVRWIEDLKKAIENYQSYNANGDTVASSNAYSSLKSNNESVNDDNRSPSIQHNVIQHRANNTMHVCWHRNTSVSLQDHCVALENQLSGYLLRKFKNSNGWQKLWVVFTNFCLFFYKNYQDDFPLASLPLLNYMISTPSENDNINKDFVFKLQFKNHVYFFRAESHVTFSRLFYCHVFCFLIIFIFYIY
ncbi:hypothetical protein HELRODRAFT_89207, partial [Helobdella robusta]|uniref:PH domain-containing protein n=1 Tax=Helobdella robusta TaxID=6412 RepID=T1G7A3_HELRO